MKLEIHKNYENFDTGFSYEINFLPSISFVKGIANYKALFITWLLWGIKIVF